MSNEDDECDSSSLFTVTTHSDVNSFLRAQAAKITAVASSISDDDDDSSMDGSLVARFTQIPSEKKFVFNSSNARNKPYLSRSCFASIASSSPVKPSSSSQKILPLDDLTELKWLNTFKLKELKDDFNNHEMKEKEKTGENNSSTQQQEQNQNNNNDEDRLAKLISELKSYDYESTKIITTSFGVLLFLALYSKRDEKQLSWSLTIKQLYEYVQLNAKQITNKRGWKNALRQALITIPCFVRTKRDLLKSRSLWTIDPYYRPLLTKAYLTIPPTPSPSANKTLSEAATNRHDEQDGNRPTQSIVSNFAPKATVKPKVLPRLYIRLCEEKINDDDDGDEADSSHTGKRTRSLSARGKRPRSSSSSGRRISTKGTDTKRHGSSSPFTAKLIKRHKRRHQRYSDAEPKTSTPSRGSNGENRSSAIVTPCPSMDHNYLLATNTSKKTSTIVRTGSTEYHNPSSDESEEEEEEYDDDEHDSNSTQRKSIITTRAQATSRTHSKNRRKSLPPKKCIPSQYPSHRPNTRINRRIIEHDLKLLRQANILAPLSPPTNPQPLDLSLGHHRSPSFDDMIEKSHTTGDVQSTEDTIEIKTTPIDGVLDLSLSR